MSEPARAFHRYAYSDYLALEQDSPIKHEYFSGEIYAMAGGTPEHAALAMAVATALGRQLVGGECRLFSSDLRVRILATGLTTYPDLSVICGPLERDPESHVTATNPRFIVEVTSPSTEDYDRGEKLEHYQRVPTIEACLIVSHREPNLELWLRREEGWTLQRARRGETLRIDSLNVELAVDEIYAGVLEGL